MCIVHVGSAITVDCAALVYASFYSLSHFFCFWEWRIRAAQLVRALAAPTPRISLIALALHPSEMKSNLIKSTWSKSPLGALVLEIFKPDDTHPTFSSIAVSFYFRSR